MHWSVKYCIETPCSVKYLFEMQRFFKYCMLLFFQILYCNALLFQLLCSTTLKIFKSKVFHFTANYLTFSEELIPVAPGYLSAQWLLNQQWNLAWIASLMNPIALHLVVYFTPHKSRDSLLLLHRNIWEGQKLTQKNSYRGKGRCRSKI